MNWIGHFNLNLMLFEPLPHGVEVVDVDRKVSLAGSHVRVRFLKEMQFSISQAKPDNTTILKLFRSRYLL